MSSVRVALVTGAARRLGRVIALELARAGYVVVLHYRSSESEARETAQLCMALGAPSAPVLQADLTNPAQRADLVERAFALVEQPITLLVNNASLFEYDQAQSFTPTAFDAHLQTNYLAPVELTLALYRAYRARALPGPAHVVTLLDQKVANLNTDYLSYTLAKLASQSSIRFLAQCCAPTLRVNAVAPGVTLLSGDMTESQLETARSVAALGESSSAIDIAHAICMLDFSPRITGQTLVVDGGQHLIPRARDVAFEDQ